MTEVRTVSSTEALVARAREQAAEGRAIDAIAELTGANRMQPDGAIERALVELRVDAWDQLDRTGPLRSDDPPVPDLFAGETGIPEVSGADLDATVIHSAMQHHGSLVIRELLSPSWCARLRNGIDRSWEAIERFQETQTSDLAWFEPLRVGGYGSDMFSRIWGITRGTAYVADSPRLFFDLLEAFDAIGLKETMAKCFGETPVVSLAKTAQRRLPPDAVGGWHQDAAVYGMAAHALDCWIPMSRCGDVAPGLTLWPRRLDHVVRTVGPGPTEFGTHPDAVEELTAEVPAVSPIFAPGDAVIIDEMTLHTTHSDPGFTEARYGFETWFFTPSGFPDPDLRVPIVY